MLKRVIEEIKLENMKNLKEASKTKPYIKYLMQKSGYNKGNIKVINDIPENYIDYLLVDIEALRLSELKIWNNGYNYTLEIGVLNNMYEVSMQFGFLISKELKDKIDSRMLYFFGEPEKVNYNLKTQHNLRLLKGGKINE